MSRRPATTTLAPPSVEPIDYHLGARLRSLRVAQGRSRAWLDQVSGVSMKQIEKFERGDARMACQKLYAFAMALGVNPGYFFEGFEDGGSVLGAYQQGKSLDGETPPPDVREPHVQRFAALYAGLPRLEQNYLREALRFVRQSVAYRQAVQAGQIVPDDGGEPASEEEESVAG